MLVVITAILSGVPLVVYIGGFRQTPVNYTLLSLVPKIFPPGASGRPEDFKCFLLSNCLQWWGKKVMQDGDDFGKTGRCPERWG